MSDSADSGRYATKGPSVADTTTLVHEMHHVTIVNRSAWGKYTRFALLASILVGAALLVRAHESAIATFIDHHASQDSVCTCS
jgi:hypothetical protein